jgi:hypothetical protein
MSVNARNSVNEAIWRSWSPPWTYRFETPTAAPPTIRLVSSQ